MNLFANINHKTFMFFKIVAPIVCLLVLFAGQISPLHAQINTQLIANSQSAQVWYLTNDAGQVATVIVTPFTNSGTFSESSSSAGWWMNIPGVNPMRLPLSGTVAHSSGGDLWSFTITVAQGSVSTQTHSDGTANGNFPYATHVSGTVSGTVTTPMDGAKSVSGNWYGDLQGSSTTSTSPPTTSSTPTSSPTAVPALPTAQNLGSVSQIQGSAWFTYDNSPVTTQSQIETGSVIHTDNNTVVGFSYPDQGGTVYLGGNSDFGWVYPEPQFDVNANVSYKIVPSPLTGTVPFETGLQEDPMGQATITLPVEIGIAVLLLGETLPAALVAGVIVEGVLMLPDGIAYIHEQLSPQGGTYNVRPIDLPQGLVMGDGTDYIVTVTSQGTLIQVISGSVIFIDHFTHNNVTLSSGQTLKLPVATPAGFSSLDLKTDTYTFDLSTLNQWWNITPVATTSPIYTSTAAPSATPITGTTAQPIDSTGTGSFLSNPEYIAALLIVFIAIIIVIATVSKTKRKKKRQQADLTNKETPSMPLAAATTPQTKPETQDANNSKVAFCSSCGKQLPTTKSFCPFCGAPIA